MDFEALKENLTKLLAFVQPVAVLVSDVYHAVCERFPEFGMLANVAKWVFVIIIVICLFIRLVSD